jgi:hypothetical protein
MVGRLFISTSEYFPTDSLFSVYSYYLLIFFIIPVAIIRAIMWPPAAMKVSLIGGFNGHDLSIGHPDRIQ